ncbi:MAG: hypothetical protein KC416_01235 [Myxococcales bacterium]|nr:hypothetical protein [Myxococcales bacterium]
MIRRKATLLNSSTALCLLAFSVLALSGCESDEPTDTPRRNVDSGTGKDGGGIVDGGSRDGAVDGGGIDRSILVADLDEDTLKALCQDAQLRRYAVQPGDTDLIKLYCTVRTGLEKMPDTLVECNQLVQACINDQMGMVPPETAAAFDLLCDSPPDLDPDVTVGELLDCWSATDAEIQQIEAKTSCEGVVADPTSVIFMNPPICNDILLGDAGTGM